MQSTTVAQGAPVGTLFYGVGDEVAFSASEFREVVSAIGTCWGMRRRKEGSRKAGFNYRVGRAFVQSLWGFPVVADGFDRLSEVDFAVGNRKEQWSGDRGIGGFGERHG